MDFQTLEHLVVAPGQQPDFTGCIDAIPVLARLASTPQEPAYHGEGDVWTHTCMVVEAMVNGGAYKRASAEERFVLFYAALLHDIAKPDTTVIDPTTGRIGQRIDRCSSTALEGRRSVFITRNHLPNHQCASGAVLGVER